MSNGIVKVFSKGTVSHSNSLFLQAADLNSHTSSRYVWTLFMEKKTNYNIAFKKYQAVQFSALSFNWSPTFVDRNECCE